MSVGLDREDVEFLEQVGVFKSTAEGVRFAVKFLHLYGVPAIKAIKVKSQG